MIINDVTASQNDDLVEWSDELLESGKPFISN